jgi:phenylalanyl-tRNA synthetase beta chain
MPTVNFNKWKLLEKLKIDEKSLEEILFKLKSESKIIDENTIEIEVNADRPDLLISDGIKRAIDGLLSRKLGEAIYETFQSEYSLTVEEVKARPYVVGAIIRGLKIDEDYLREIIQFQEKLHSTVGRKRKKVAIGLHDLDKIDGKNIIYKEVTLDTRFIPLGYNKQLSIKEVIEFTPQGIEYGKISLRENKIPAITQDNGEILSIPPIINSEKTKITTLTTNLFVDITGTSLDAIIETLDIIVTNFAEAGAKIGIINLNSNYLEKSPVLKKRNLTINTNYINKVLGTSFDIDVIVNELLKARISVSKVSEELINIIIPPYRVDLKTPIDIVEEVAMMIGYENLIPKQFYPRSTGKISQKSIISRKLRDLVIGAKYEEILTFVLISSKYLNGEYVKISNPVSEEYNAVRNSLLPNILLFLRRNQYARFPVRIFEIGEVVVRDHNSDTGYSNEFRLGIAIMNSKVSYEELQSDIHSILLSLGLQPEYKSVNDDKFIKGRVSKIIVNNIEIGILGEINPEILENLEIYYPVVAGELYLDKIQTILFGGGVSDSNMPN